ncbi:RICIN domain-containing protein [Pseudomarimonas arenosa]|uniref:Ricin B lectin domain-containing protein n=1 Tax=Pseudomarimonas arenosa TaxID=2774145 RepID=A0AAW3ZLC0_9GAMM|nr:hypothetical protein [Pseudomarimonas arenosa]MBD8525969.1 hypothetical protein [Pseudomarimonas arenosa]
MIKIEKDKSNFWSFATSAVSLVLPVLLGALADKKTGKRPSSIHRIAEEVDGSGAITLFAQGEVGNPVVTLNNTTTSTMANLSFISNTEHGIQCDVVQVLPASDSVDVQNLFQQYEDGGNVGVSVYPTPSSSNRTLNASLLNLEGVLVGNSGTQFSVGLPSTTESIQFTVFPTKIDIVNSSSVSQNVSITVEQPDNGDMSFTLSTTVNPNQARATLEFPDDIQIQTPLNLVIETLNDNIIAEKRAKTMPNSVQGSAYYIITSVDNNKRSISANSTEVTTSITDPTQPTQQWVFTPVFNPNSAIPQGGYMISPNSDPGNCITYKGEDEQLELAPFNSNDPYNQLWDIVLSKGSNTLFLFKWNQIKNNNTVMELDDDNVIAHEQSTPHDSQRWTFSTGG